jgi:hypothetical protein
MNKSDNANLTRANGINIHQSHKADQEKSEFSYISEKNPGNLNGSIAYWNSRYLDLYCLTEHKQKNPTYFVTFTQNDRLPEYASASIDADAYSHAGCIKYCIKDAVLSASKNYYFMQIVF